MFILVSLCTSFKISIILLRINKTEKKKFHKLSTYILQVLYWRLTSSIQFMDQGQTFVVKVLKFFKMIFFFKFYKIRILFGKNTFWNTISSKNTFDVSESHNLAMSFFIFSFRMSYNNLSMSLLP